MRPTICLFKRPRSLGKSALFALTLLTGTLLFAGCDKPAPPPKLNPAPVEEASPDETTPVTEPDPAVDSEEKKNEEVENTPGDPPAATEPEVASVESGAQLYARHCAACHGEQGNGRGLAAAYLFPKPRDFQAGRFRLVSTSNNVPSREDLHKVLLRGMPGSSMPPWGHLSQAQRDALVDEVMRLRIDGARNYYIALLKEQDDLSDEELADEDIQAEINDYVERFTIPGESSDVPQIGAPTEQEIAAAKQTYTKFGCLQCHGAEGKGDGVQQMLDEEGFPTAPRDFTAGIFKGGADPADLYRRIAYGLPGTPMPSSKQLTPQQITELVHYIRSMSTEESRQAAVLNRARITAKRIAAVGPEMDDAAWAGIPGESLRMTPLWWRNNADPDLQVQAAHDGRTLAVRLSWQDAEGDLDALRSESFEDAVAMELYRGSAEPFLGMGGPTSAVDVWFWDADRQGAPAVEEAYPNSVVDVYPFSEKVASSPELNRPGARTQDQPDISLPARASGNQIVPPGDGEGSSSLEGGGPGTATFHMPRNQFVQATGEWREGRWTVLMTRPLKLATPEAGVSLDPGDEASVAFAIWDGAAQDRDGKKLITIWQDLILEN